MKFPTYKDKDGTNLAEVGTDAISRQAAIDVLDRNFILGQGLLNDTLDHIADAKMEVEHGE